MANIILGLIPSYPTVVADFPLLIAGLTFEIYDVNVTDLDTSTSNLVLGTPSPTFNPVHSVAKVNITISSSSNEYESIDLRIVVKRGMDTIVDQILNYNFDDSLNPGGYIVIPPVGPNVQAIFRKDGLPPLYNELFAAVTSVLDTEVPPAGTLSIIDLSLEQCRHVARELVWGNNDSSLPKPDKRLWKLYTLNNSTDDLSEKEEEARQKFESELQSYYSRPNAEAENFTKYIWALRCALKISQKIADASETTEMLFQFPLRLQTNNVNKVNVLAVKLTGSINDKIQIEPEPLYALGVEMPVQIDEDERLNIIIRTEEKVLLEQFKKATENGVININIDADAEDEYQSYTPDSITNKFEIIRRLHSLNVNHNNLPTCSVTSGSDLESLLISWSTYPMKKVVEFWLNINTILPTIGVTAHYDLVVCAIINDESNLTTEINSNAPTFTDLEDATLIDWETWFITAETAFGNELHLNFIPPGLSIEERAKVFANYVQQFFEPGGAGNAFAGPGTFPPPSTFGYRGIVEEYITLHGLDPSHVAAFIEDDLCIQEWLQKKIEQLSFLHTIVSGLTYDDGNDTTPEVPFPAPLTFSFMESLFSKGFVSSDSITDCTFEEFQEALTGTVAYDQAEKIYLGAGGVLAPASVPSPTNLRDVLTDNCYILKAAPTLAATVITTLHSNSIYTPQDIVDISAADFEELFEALLGGATGISLGVCAEAIYSASGSWTPPTNSAYLEDVLISNCPLLASDPALLVGVVTQLANYGIYTPLDISLFTDAEFGMILVGINSGLANCAKLIYDGAVGWTPPIENTDNVFIPVNPGNLINCIPSPESSPLSPVAYLHDLTLIGTGSTCAQPFAFTPLSGFATTSRLIEWIKIRRGNLSGLEASLTNQKTCIPYLDIINERLAGLVIEPDPVAATPWVPKNTSIASALGHQLQIEGHEPTSNEYHHSPEVFFEAIPEHLPWDAADIIRNDFSNPSLPYSLPKDILESYLQCLGSDPFEIRRKFRHTIHEFAPNPDLSLLNNPASFRGYLHRYPPSFELSLSYLGFTQKESDFLFAHPNLSLSRALILYSFTNDTYGDGDWVEEAVKLKSFLQRTGLKYCDIHELIKATEGWSYVDFNIIDKFENPVNPESCEPCSLIDYKLSFQPSDETGLKRIILFIRIWQKLKGCISFIQLRDICEDLGLLTSGSSTIHPNLIRKLAAFIMLHKEFGLPLQNESFSNTFGANRTHILALWKDSIWRDASPTNLEIWNWARGAFIDSVQKYAIQHYGSTYCPTDFVELLKENLDAFSLAAGFGEPSPDNTWDNCPFNTIRYADYISKFLASDFSYGEHRWIFSNEETPGDNPFQIQSPSESCCYPLDFPDNNSEFSLTILREKLCKITVTEEEVETYNWQKIEEIYTYKFGADTSANSLLAFAEKFLPNILIENGYNVPPTNRQFRVSVTSNAPLWNTSNPPSPIKYDSLSGELWTELPFSTQYFYEKISRIRQLNNNVGDSEQEAVKELFYLPYTLLTPLAFVFEDFSQVRKFLIEESDEQARWNFFRNQFALFYKRTQCIADFLATFTNSITCMEHEYGKEIAWKLMKNMYADENFPIPPASWENADGSIPAVTWQNTPNGSSFASMLGVMGNGLVCNFYDLDDNLLWRDIARSTNFFGEIENEWNAPIPAFVPNIGFSNTTSYATIRNGFAIDGSTAQPLGGAQGFRIQCSGFILIEEDGKYTFMAGEPTPGAEAPLFDDDMVQQWKITLKKEQKKWNLLSHNWNGEGAPPDATFPIKLQKGAHRIFIEYIHPQPNFEDENKICPQKTGFQIKYSGPDTENILTTIPFKQLFSERKTTILADGLNLQGAPLKYLSAYYPTTLNCTRNTFQRLVKAMVLAYRFCWSAINDGDDGTCEIDFLLSNSECFKGHIYYWNQVNYMEHAAQLDLNLLPVVNNYCQTDDAGTDQRNTPSDERKAAFGDLFELMFDYKHIKEKTKSAPEPSAWKLLKEVLEAHEDGKVHLLRHLGVDTNLVDIATTLYDNYIIPDEDMKDVNWIMRICQNAVCLEKMKCLFPFQDLTQIQPALWAANDDELQDGVENLTQIIRNGLIENGEPRRYNVLKQINDAIRLRNRNAMIFYLTTMDRVEYNGHPIRNVNELGQFLIMDVEAGICQKMSRIEEAINAFQTFVSQAIIGLEDEFVPSTLFSQLWNKKMGTYLKWEKCKHREIYYEDWVEYDKIEEARKSEAYRFLEKRLEDQTLTIPVSGGAPKGTAALLTSPKPPSHPQINLLQKRESSLLNKMKPIEGFDMLGSPDKYAASWLSSENSTLPYWLESAARLEIPFLIVPASGLPVAGITYECENEGCCSICGEIHDPIIDEYLFMLMDAKTYKTLEVSNPNEFEALEQEASWFEDAANNLDDLLFIDTDPTVYLVVVKKHNGKFLSPRKSSESIKVTAGSSELSLIGRTADSIEVKVSNAGDANQSFWYNIVDSNINVLPKNGVEIPSENGPMGWMSNPYFIYFEPGAPNVPKSNFSTALAVAESLKMHCQFPEMLRWFELEINPLKEDNTWIQDNEKETACRKAILMKYLDALVCWGKALFQQNTGESIQQASTVFKTAKKILGECPSIVHEKQDISSIQKVATFQPKLAGLNRRLLCLYEEVKSNCDWIHDCVNNWKLPSDKSKPSFFGNGNQACNNSSTDCYDETYWCVAESPYKFEITHRRALDLANQLTSVGNALLQAIEKCDGETMSNLQQTQSKQILDLSLSIKEKLARESNWNRQSTEVSLELAYNRLAYNQNLIANGLISQEDDYLTFIDQSMVSTAIGQAITASSSSSNLIPTPYIGPFPLSEVVGGKALAAIILTAAEVARIVGTIQGTRAGKRIQESSFARRLQGWQQTVSEILLEIKNLKRQLLANKLRESVALQEANNHLLQIEHTNETLAFMQEKFSNQELYHWMKKELTGLYYQFYECALKVAKQAELQYNKECGFTNEQFFNFPIWDNCHQGLIAGEKIQLALQQMGKKYYDKNVREYELTKHFSMLKFFPREFLRLKHTGRCIITLPEWSFDQDHCGHYRRRIISFAVTIPCVTGPYSNINSKAILLNSKIRVSSDLKCKTSICCHEDDLSNYLCQPEDSRFVFRYGAKEAMATSTGNQDSGVRQLNFNDERYLPFECEGAISTWCIELLQENNYFDICSVSDFIIHLNYDAKEGGKLLAEAAKQETQRHLPGDGWKLFDIPNEFPDAIYQLESAFEDDTQPNELLIQLRRNHFDFIPGKHHLFIDRLEIFFEACNELECTHYEIQLLMNPKDRDEHPDKCELITIQCYQRDDMGCLFHGVVDLENISIPNKGTEDIGILIFPQELECISKMYLLAGYHIEKMEKELKTKGVSTSRC